MVDHFSKVLKEDNLAGNQVIRRSLINSIPRSIREEENDWILGKISEEEVKKAVFSMKAFKAPGPNGFLTAFFQHF